jgi:hypothetical protein
MARIQNIIRDGKRLARLTNIAFLLSILLLSGYVSEGAVRLSKGVQTETVFSVGTVSKSTVSFRYCVLPSGRLDCYASDPAETASRALLRYNCDIKTKLRRHSKKIPAIRKHHKILTSRYSPGDPDALIISAKRKDVDEEAGELKE